MSIVIYVLLFCFFKQNQAFVIPSELGVIGGITNFNENGLERRSPQEVLMQVNTDPPSFESQFLINGQTSSFPSILNSPPITSSNQDVPFSSGTLINPQINPNDPLYQNNNNPPMLVESFTADESGPLGNQNINTTLPQQPVIQSPTSAQQTLSPNPPINFNNQPPLSQMAQQSQSQLTQPIPSQMVNSGMFQPQPPQQTSQTIQQYPPQITQQYPPIMNSNPPPSMQQVQSMIPSPQMVQPLQTMVPQSQSPMVPSSSSINLNNHHPPIVPSSSTNLNNYMPPPINTNFQQQPNQRPELQNTQQIPQQMNNVPPQSNRYQAELPNAQFVPQPSSFQTPQNNPTSMPSFSQSQPQYFQQPQPIVRMSSTGISSSTLASSTNNQPPEFSHQALGYNLNYDSTKLNDPMNGKFVGMNGYTPNVSDPSKYNYVAVENSYPTQTSPTVYYNGIPYQNIQGELLPNVQGSLPSMQAPGSGNQAFNTNGWLPNQKVVEPSRIFPQTQQNVQNMMNHMSNHLGPLTNPSSYIPSMSNMGQQISGLLRDAMVDGLHLAETPIKIPMSILSNLERDIPHNNLMELMRIPIKGTNAVLESANDILRMLENNLKSLSRRSPDAEPEPWMPSDLTSSIPNFAQNFNQISFGAAQDRINSMKNNIFNRMQSSFPPISFPSMPSISSIPSMSSIPSIPSSGNGQPIVKMSSTSVSESTSSISKNGGPPEVSHQASGFDLNYDSTKTDNPLESDLVAMQAYTPNAYDPDQTIYDAVESTFPPQSV